MTDEEITRRARQSAASELSPDQWDRRADAMSIKEFCRRHSISPSFYYVLKKKSLTPGTIKLGNRRLISAEEAARWRAQRLAAV